MSYRMQHRNITWAQFEYCNQDIHKAFENMCRLLFSRKLLENKHILHSNPNNPGVEVEPVLESISNKRISFQAKYMSSINYNLIMNSAQKIVNYYTGQLDIVYLYCNKDLTTTSTHYKNIEAVLTKSNIQIVLISNQSILDQVIDYPVIASLFFNHHHLTNDWFNEHLLISLNSLGPRYNSTFNVETRTEEYIDLFSHNNEAISRINQKKIDAIKEISNYSWKYTEYADFINKLILEIKSLNNVEVENIIECLEWSSIIQDTFSNEFDDLNKEINKKREVALSKKNNEQEQRKIEQDIQELQYLVSVPSLLEFDEIEKSLIQRKMLIVKGNAGVGKSQLFANASQKSIQSNGFPLLLLGQSFLSDHNIIQQILEYLGLNFSIDDLLNILEGIGEVYHQCIVILIDAINESRYKKIWETGLVSLVIKINKLNYVRLAVSARNGYENLVFGEAIQQMIKNNEIVSLNHTGFIEESIEATKTFLNYYNIPFSPTYFLQYEMTNPLFLTLFCKTYDGGEFDMFTLLEKIISKANNEAQRAIEYDGSKTILMNLIKKIVEFQILHDRKSISREDLLKLDFWETYGLSNSKIPFISELEKIGLLTSYASGDEEFYFFGYNLLEDFIWAKFIIDKYTDKVSVKNYLVKDLLRIENNRITNHSSIDTFIIICSLYAEKYSEECMDIIETLSDELYDKQDIIDRYVDSFLWRKSCNVKSEVFIDFLENHSVSLSNVWRVFIGNSTKTNHTLNADLLHKILLNKTISQRDYLWTIYINEHANEEDRLFQLIDLFDKGDTLDGLNEDNIRLLLTLFAWLLTSSNRMLRDKTSKAMIELLKMNFHMCKTLLKKFETVNDPYVIQRLYGIVFGACMKRAQKHKTEYKELVKYIYNSVFNKATVYPDILLRDYARLIIERYLYEFIQAKRVLDVSKIRPPYKSSEIPVVSKEKYYQNDAKKSGFNSISFSMHPDHIDGQPGGYGDFGRYIFQAAVTHFDDIDMTNIYHHAMQYIRDELGYDDKLFGEYDTSLRKYYDSHKTIKTERIGKKYQWITMYNILARISDKHLLKGYEDKPYPFQGAWEPYVRDFDPTLNCNFLIPYNLPKFELLKYKADELIKTTSIKKNAINEWIRKGGDFFSSHNSKLEIRDSLGLSWILLYQYENINSNQDIQGKYIGRFEDESQDIWSMSHGYFVKQNEFSHFKNNLIKKNFMGRWFPEGSEYYQLYNREYTWSPSCQSLLSDTWLDCEIDTGETKTIICNDSLPNEENLNNIENDEKYKLLSFIFQKREAVAPVKRKLGCVMPSFLRTSWESQYDASLEESITYEIPCKSIIDYLHLEQQKYDGYFYSKDGTLVSFDGNLANICKGLLIRKDYLDKYLKENNLRLFWTCFGEKQYSLGDGQQIIGEWSGFFYLEGDKVEGVMEYKKCFP